MAPNASELYSVTSFGPVTPGEFDFTPLFEDTILSIVPSAILLLSLPFRVFTLHRKPRKVSRSALHGQKLLFLIVYTGMQIALLILHALNPSLRTHATIAAATLTVLDGLGLCLLSHSEHIHSVRPSAIINAYLLLTLPFDVARSRTLWLGQATRSIGATFTSALAVKLIILIAEAIEKRAILLDRYRYSSPEVTSGIYSRSFFWWLNTLMRIGYLRVIHNKDLYPIDEDMSSSTLNEHAQKVWTGVDKSQPRALFWATLKASRLSFFYCILPRICLIGFRYAQPFLLSRTVDFANSPGEPDRIGWALTAAFGLVFVGLAVINGSYYHMTYRFITSVRGTLVSMIYTKTIELSVTALDESAAVTLMASDTEAICQGFTTLHELWAAPIELGIALYLLQIQLGLAFLATACVALFSTAGVLMMAKYIGNAQKTWIQGIQTRVDVTAAMLASMKGIKMLGFTNIMSGIVQGLRMTELRLSRKFRKLLLVRVFLANSTGAIAPLATFVIFVIVANSTGKELNAAASFTALSLISLLTEPMNTLIRAIPELNASMACFSRIQAFLNSGTRMDHRLPLDNGADFTEERESNTSKSNIVLQDLSPVLSPEGTSPIMVMQNASFGWDSGANPDVSDISFTLLRRQFCFIIGPVGSGKSTLLKGLLGETPSSQGFVYSNTRSIAYNDQSPWIQNGTVKQNILGVSSFEEPWYSQVVRVCALEFDISKLPKGHETLVGSAGISLSGGQKQRIALARAVYARKELVILDDVFSGLDADTEERVFQHLFSAEGLFRKMGTTVLLVTHAVHRLSHSDHIISLDPFGRISQQGSYRELRTSSGYVQDVTTKLRTNGDSQSQEQTKPTLLDIHKLKSNVDEQEAQEEEINRQSGDFAVYKYYFAAIGWPQTLIFVAFVVLNGVGSQLTQLVMTYWTSAVEARGNEVNSYYLGLYGLLTGLGVIGLTGGAGQLVFNMVQKSAAVLHSRLLNTVMGAPLSFFSSTDIGTTTNRFSQDMTVIDAELPYALIDLAFSIVGALMGAILMCLSTGYFAATLPAVVLAVWILQKYYLRTSRQLRLLDLEAKSPLYSHFIESLSGLVTIRAFGWSDYFKELNLKLLDVSQKPYYLLFCIQRWLALLLDLMVAVMAVILMILVVKLRTDISGSFVGLALLNVMNFNESLAVIIKNWTNLETSFGAIARLKSFSTYTISENLPRETQSVPDNWPSGGTIELRNVSASYAVNSDLVLRNFSMSVLAGQKIGICGRSGSGKSSLVSTLFRMLEVTDDSSITVDGVDITTIPRQVVRERLNAIPQDSFFLTGTIRMNADPYGQHTDVAIIEVIQKVHLWNIVLQKGGLDAELEAEFFSHGQRQLFCLARAILRKSKLIILDEVTSSVDLKSDELMQQVIRKEFKDCTIIAVAHRLDTIMDFDRIALLSGGELVEFDTPEALLGRPSAFRELYNS